MRTKTLSFKKLDRMKVIALVFAVAFIFSPSVRVATANTLYTVADLITTK
jgi:uncharacterized membrane protein